MTVSREIVRPRRRPRSGSAVLVLAAALWAGLAHAAVPEPPDDELRRALSAAVNQPDSFEDRFHAEVWLLDMSSRLQRRVPGHDERIELLKHVHYEASRADLPPELVLAVIDVESNFDPFAISTAGAQGLMQIMPFWLNEIGRPEDNLFDVRTNLRFGCTILRHYLEREAGDLRQALARYNGSIGKSWYPDRVFKALSSRWFRR